jgi:type II secretory pathway pseudopilin PulG
MKPHREFERNPPRGYSLREYLISGVITVLIVAGALALVTPVSRGTRQASKRSQCKNNLKQILLAVHNYHDDYGSFPPAYTVDAEGRPLHSWRTLLLPYMDGAALYEKIDLAKSWDDPANAEAFSSRGFGLNCPSVSIPPNYTTYLAVVGPDAGFHPTRARTLQDFTSGTSQTLIIFEVDAEHAVHWMSPVDASPDLITSFGPRTKTPHAVGFHTAYADGSVRFLEAKVPAEMRKKLMSITAEKPSE